MALSTVHSGTTSTPYLRFICEISKNSDIKKKYNLFKTLFIQHFTFDGAFILCFLALSKQI